MMLDFISLLALRKSKYFSGIIHVKATAIIAK